MSRFICLRAYKLEYKPDNYDPAQVQPYRTQILRIAPTHTTSIHLGDMIPNLEKSPQIHIDCNKRLQRNFCGILTIAIIFSNLELVLHSNI